MRHVPRTHRVAHDWLFDRINLDTQIQIKYIDSRNQLADILTKGNFTRDEWNYLLTLSNISHFSSPACIAAMAKRAQQESGEGSVTAKSRPMMNLTARSPSFVSSSASSNPGRTSYGYQDPEKYVLDDRTGQPVETSRSDYLQKDYGRSWSSQEWTCKLREMSHVQTTSTSTMWCTNTLRTSAGDIGTLAENEPPTNSKRFLRYRDDKKSLLRRSATSGCVRTLIELLKVQLDEYGLKLIAGDFASRSKAKAKPQRRELAGSSPRIVPMERRNWIDIEPGKYSLSEYEVSKKVIHLLRHSQKVCREEDGAEN